MTFKCYKARVLEDPRSSILSFTPDGRNHYVYRVSKDNKHYYGSRTDVSEPQIGKRYFTCSKYLEEDFRANPNSYKVKVIKEFNNADDKMLYESYLHQHFNVKNNDVFINQVNQTPYGFDTTGKFTGGDNHSSGKILEINIITGEINRRWDSIKQASDFHKIDRSNIGACVQGRQAFSKNLVWCYEEDYDNEFKQNVINTDYPLRLSVLQINIVTGEIEKEWDNIKQAVDAKEGNGVRIALSLKNSTLTSKGSVWVYPENYNEVKKQEIINTCYERTGSNHHAARVIYKLDKNTGEILGKFLTIKDARATIPKGNIDVVLSGKQKTAGGFCWTYEENLEETIKNIQGKLS